MVVAPRDIWLNAVVAGTVAPVVDGTLNESREPLVLAVVDGRPLSSAHDASDATMLAGAVKIYGHAALMLRFSSSLSIHARSARSDTV